MIGWLVISWALVALLVATLAWVVIGDSRAIARIRAESEARARVLEAAGIVPASRAPQVPAHAISRLEAAKAKRARKAGRRW